MSTLGVIERILNSWDRVAAATKKVECALPGQMTEAMAELILSREAHERLLVLAARDEHARIRRLADTPIIVFWNGKPVEEMTREEVEECLDELPAAKAAAIASFDNPFYRPAPWETKEKLEEAHAAFETKAQARLKELTS